MIQSIFLLPSVWFQRLTDPHWLQINNLIFPDLLKAFIQTRYVRFRSLPGKRLFNWCLKLTLFSKQRCIEIRFSSDDFDVSRIFNLRRWFRLMQRLPARHKYRIFDALSLRFNQLYKWIHRSNRNEAIHVSHRCRNVFQKEVSTIKSFVILFDWTFILKENNTMKIAFV